MTRALQQGRDDGAAHHTSSLYVSAVFPVSSFSERRSMSVRKELATRSVSSLVAVPTQAVRNSLSARGTGQTLGSIGECTKRASSGAEAMKLGPENVAHQVSSCGYTRHSGCAGAAGPAGLNKAALDRGHVAHIED